MNDSFSSPSSREPLRKGLSSLLGLDNKNANPSHSGQALQIAEVEISKVFPNPKQPRKVFREEDLKSLAQSLKQDGIIQPLIVSRDGDRYMIVAGERRWRASQLAGMTQVPVIVKEVTPEEMLRIAIIENVQRANLNVIEEAEAYATLIRDFGLTQEECAKRVGKDRTTISNFLRILGLPPQIQDDLMNERLTMGHGKAFLALENPSLLLQARELVIAKKMNVRQTEQLVRRMKREELALEKEEGGAPVHADLDYLADTLRSHLRTKVKLHGSGSRGRIEISFFSPAELERLLQLIGSGAF